MDVDDSPRERIETTSDTTRMKPDSTTTSTPDARRTSTTAESNARLSGKSLCSIT